MSRIEARRKKASALRLRHSQSLASLRQRLSHAIVRSTIQRLDFRPRHRPLGGRDVLDRLPAQARVARIARRQAGDLGRPRRPQGQQGPCMPLAALPRAIHAQHHGACRQERAARRLRHRARRCQGRHAPNGAVSPINCVPSCPSSPPSSTRPKTDVLAYMSFPAPHRAKERLPPIPIDELY
jgi:hypothetical protein